MWDKCYVSSLYSSVCGVVKLGHIKERRGERSCFIPQGNLQKVNALCPSETSLEFPFVLQDGTLNLGQHVRELPPGNHCLLFLQEVRIGL